MERSRVVTSESTNTIGPENRHEEMELALVDELVESLEEGKGINRDAVGGGGDDERNRLWKGSIEGDLKV